MLAAVLSLSFVAFVPGAIIAAAATPTHSRMRRVAVAASPSITYGLVGALVGWAGLVGRPLAPLQILAAELGVAVVAVATRLWVARHRAVAGWGVSRDRIRQRLSVHLADVVSLGAALVLALVVAWRMVGHLPTAPGWDALNHAFMTSRILTTGSGLPSSVCVTGDALPSSACTFYPLAANVVWAQAVELGGATLSAVILASVWFVIPVTAVVGVFAVLRVCGAAPAVAAAAAFLPALVGPIWPSLVTGRITILLGAVLAPSAALLLWMALRAPRVFTLTAVAAVGVAGVALAHTYDLLVAVALFLGLLVTRPATGPRGVHALQGLIALGTTALLLLPQAPGLLAARDERFLDRPRRHPVEVWRALTDDTFPRGGALGTLIPDAVPGAEALMPPVGPMGAWVSGVLTGMLLLGIAVSFLPRFRWARPFAVSHAVMMLVTLWVSAGSGPLHDAVAQAFYEDPRRTRWSSALAPGVLSLTGALAVVAGVVWAVGKVVARLRAGVTPPSARLRAVGEAALAATLATATACFVLAVPETNEAPGRLAARSLPDDPGYARAIAYVEAHGGGVVAEDFHRDFIPWVTTDAGLPTLFGMQPLAGPRDPDWAERLRVWRTVIGRVRPADRCLRDPFGVRWVVVGDAHMPGGSRTWSVARLARSEYAALALVSGGVRVYEVRDPCSTR